CAADERTLPMYRIGKGPHVLIGLYRRGFTLGRDRSGRFVLKRARRRVTCGLSDQDLPGMCRSLEPLRSVHRIADHRIGGLELTAEHSSDDLSRIAPDAKRETRVVTRID